MKHLIFEVHRLKLVDILERFSFAINATFWKCETKNRFFLPYILHLEVQIFEEGRQA
jgi:hypothetical protein